MRRIVLALLLLSGSFFAWNWFAVSSDDYRPQLTIGLKFCDYRFLITKCLVEDEPYRPVSIPAHDACYPPIAYCLVKLFPLTPCGEVCYVSFLFVGLAAGLVFFMRQRRLKDAVLLIGAVVMTVPFASGPLRGNPAAWATGAVCVFLAWYDAEETWKRMIAASVLGFATALKLTPVVYGLLYLRGRLYEPEKWPKEEIFVAVMSFAVLFAVPFVFFGGPNEVEVWLHNAIGNSKHYSPLADFGIAPLARFVCNAPPAGVALSVHLTNLLTLLFCFAAFFAHRFYHSLVLLGVAMVFLCHHDYGLAYLLPAFACWLAESRSDESPKWTLRGLLVVESIMWILVFESALCVHSFEMLEFNERVVSNVAVILLGLLALLHVALSCFANRASGGGVRSPAHKAQGTTHKAL